MKLVAVLCLWFLAHKTAAGDIWCKPLAKSCIESENPDDSDVDQMCEGHAPAIDKGKCLLACMGETFKIVNKMIRETTGEVDLQNFRSPETNLTRNS